MTSKIGQNSEESTQNTVVGDESSFSLPGDLKQVLGDLHEPEEQIYDAGGDPSDPSDPQCAPVIEPAIVWTRKDIKEFKVWIFLCEIMFIDSISSKITK